MALTPLKYLTLPAISKHTATVIFIHGLGDTGHGWKPVADMFRKDSELNHVKWILPHSPIRAVTANMGFEMPSWFDIYSFGLQADEDKKGMIDSKWQITQLVENEINAGIPSDKIFLGGFSQGGTMSLLVGLTGEHKLAGLAILSSWLPLRNEFKSMAAPHASSTSIFWGYGSNDALIKAELTELSVKFLQSSIDIPTALKLGDKGILCKPYHGIGHETCMDELGDLKDFIKKHIPENV